MDSAIRNRSALVAHGAATLCARAFERSLEQARRAPAAHPLEGDRVGAVRRRATREPPRVESGLRVDRLDQGSDEFLAVVLHAPQFTRRIGCRTRAAGRPGRRLLLEAQLAELRPARVGRLLVPVLGARGVEILTAYRAQAQALVGAGDLGGKRESESVAGPRSQVELVTVEIGRLQVLAAARLIDLARVDREVAPGVLEAAHAGAVQPRLVAHSQGVARGHA